MTENPLTKWIKLATPLFDMSKEEEIGTGRRPLKKYPEIYLTIFDLAEVFESLDGIIPQARWKDVFMKVRDFARDQHRESGMAFNRVRCKSALTGWAKKAVVGELNEEVKLLKNSGKGPLMAPNVRPQPKAIEKPIQVEKTSPEGVKKLKSLLDEKFPNRNKKGMQKV